MSNTVVVMDDDEEFRWLVTLTLRTDPTITVVGELGDDGETARALVRQTRPDVVLLDVMMPRLDGLDTTRQIKQDCPETKVIVLTSFTEGGSRRAAYHSGADAFLNKREILTALLPAIRTVTRSRRAASRVSSSAPTSPSEFVSPRP